MAGLSFLSPQSSENLSVECGGTSPERDDPPGEIHALQQGRPARVEQLVLDKGLEQGFPLLLLCGRSGFLQLAKVTMTYWAQ